MTAFPKPKRIVNRALLAEMRKKPCLVCHAKPTSEQPSHPHHLTTRGAGGGDTPDNVIPTCFKHHAEIHTIGNIRFAEKYQNFVNWIINNRRLDLLGAGHDH